MSVYYEMVISGSFLYVKGLINGICLGASKKPDIIFNKEHNIETETLGELLKEYIGLSDILVHVIIPENLSDLIRSKLSDKSAMVAIKSIKKITEGEFEFDFEAYSEKHKNELKEIFENLPGNLELSKDTKIQEKVFKDSEGIELYSPSHSIEYKGKGKVIGPFSEIFDLFKKCEKNPLTTVEKLDLIF